ncbi:RDD family protein [Corynebacterium nuruki]|uniref:RDD family protein n=1 Tax=Corynebacterium nuruki TaxID=1032851 RepID=UPI0002485C1D|nr:RDD family protein [Corynebacterium nuruki]
MSNPYGSPGNPDDHNGNSGPSGDIPSYGDYAGGDPAQGYGQPQDPGNPYGAYPGGADQQYLGGSTLPGAGVRLGAYIIDAIILMIIAVIVGFIVGLAGGASDDGAVSAGTQFLLSVIVVVIWFAYRVGMEISAGGSVGKLILGLKVVDINGQRLSAQNSLIRNAWFIVGIIPFVGGILSFVAAIALGVTISSNPQKQSFTDKWAKSYVVRSR